MATVSEPAPIVTGPEQAPAPEHATGESVDFHVFRGTPDTPQGDKEYKVPMVPGMVVLDAMHYIQKHVDTDLAVRWNCKAAKCGSCSAEVNGRPVLMCKTRVDEMPDGPITVRPMKAFPLVKDLVVDVSGNFKVNEKITPFTPSEADASDPKPWRIKEPDIERLYEFRKCIECFLCQDVCHVLRTHDLQERFYGPRFFVRVAGLEMHPKDAADRRDLVREDGGLGLCNITKCCTEVCPEHIHITDNAIIPMKERVVDRHWDPIAWVGRIFGGGKK